MAPLKTSEPDGLRVPIKKSEPSLRKGPIALSEPKTTIILGGPGTGKTERLLQIVEEEINNGLPPERIAFVAFTREAAYGARNRAMLKFKMPEDRFPWFRTLHSVAFKALGISRLDVLQKQDMEEFFDIIGVSPSTGFTALDGPAISGPEESRCLAVMEYSRNTLRNLSKGRIAHGETVDWWKLLRLSEAYRKFKDTTGVIDFTDMLEMFVSQDLRIPVEIVLVDEVQDLTPLQWVVLRTGFCSCSRMIVAGDDDQAIFKWAGSSLATFMELEGKEEVLTKSWRLPSSVHAIASMVISQVGNRKKKGYPSSSRKGKVGFCRDLRELDFSSGTWLLLARNRYRLQSVADEIRRNGFLYTMFGNPSVRDSLIRAIQAYETLRKGTSIFGRDVRLVANELKIKVKISDDLLYTLSDLGIKDQGIWHDVFRTSLHDREYLLSCLRRNEDPRVTPRIRIDTIHGAKGAEAENVLLLTDISRQTARGFQLDPDNEHRCFYVGTTRALNNLQILLPQTSLSYRFTF